MAKKNSKVEKAFHEVFTNKPRTVDTSKSKEGQRKQMVAIALSKARRAGAHIPSYDKGGVVKETGLAMVHKGEKIVPNNDQLPQKTRAAQNSPDSDFRAGSEGSRIETGNPVCPPSKVAVNDVMCGSRGHEQQENHKGNRSRDIPKKTEMPFASNPVINNLIHKDSPELVRRQNAKARDERTGNRVTDNRVYPDNG